MQARVLQDGELIQIGKYAFRYTEEHRASVQLPRAPIAVVPLKRAPSSRKFAKAAVHPITLIAIRKMGGARFSATPHHLQRSWN